MCFGSVYCSHRLGRAWYFLGGIGAKTFGYANITLGGNQSLALAYHADSGACEIIFN